MTCIRESFERDIENHVLTIIKDDGLFRHLSFGKPDTNIARIEIATWPNYLCISGDMGCFVFSRLEDMFDFFYSSDIKLDYWAEKVQAQSIFGRGIREFSIEKFRSNIFDYINDIKDEWPIEVFEKLVKSVKYELGYIYSQHDAYAFLNNYEFSFEDYDFQFETPFEYDCHEFTYHYVWCCYAINHVVKLYKENK